MEKESKLYNTVSVDLFFKIITIFGGKYMCLCTYIQSTLEQHGFGLHGSTYTQIFFSNKYSIFHHLDVPATILDIRNIAGDIIYICVEKNV